MASIFKTLLDSDKINTRTLLHESIPITGSILSGTYNDNNIKNYAHGMFQSAYDYPYLSSSANHVIDFTCGYSADSSLSGALSTQNAKKINIYNQMAQVLSGYDATGSIQKFDQDGNILAGGTKIKEAYFMLFSRLLVKDEIKKGSCRFTLQSRGPGSPGDATNNVVVGDYGAATDYRVNSPAGEYGILYTSSATPNSNSGVGLVYYQAGIAVLTASFFTGSGLTATLGNFYNNGSDSGSVNVILSGSTIQVNANAFRNRIGNIAFNNTTELNSTIYYCRVNHNDYNYSANPTYLSSSKLVVKNSPSDSPVSYVTTVGLYSADNELLGVAKLSEPIKNTPETEFTIKARFDY